MDRAAGDRVGTDEGPREITCPRCGETRLIEIDGFTAFCNVCAKAFALTPPTYKTRSPAPRRA
jgi:hypothetical protein